MEVFSSGVESQHCDKYNVSFFLQMFSCLMLSMTKLKYWFTEIYDTLYKNSFLGFIHLFLNYPRRKLMPQKVIFLVLFIMGAWGPIWNVCGIQGGKILSLHIFCSFLVHCTYQIIYHRLFKTHLYSHWRCFVLVQVELG